MICDAEKVAAAARGWLGTPYRHQASVKGAGCDCLGLLRGVWREINGPEPSGTPPYPADWRDPMNAGALEAAAERFLLRADGSPVRGQVVLFRMHRSMPPKHCGIMVAGDRFIHAQEHIGVVEANLTDGWARRISGFFFIPDIARP